MYYVVAPDGQKYGPADVPTLNSWIADQRLFPESDLEDARNGTRMKAHQLAGLVFPSAPPAPTYTPPGGGYSAPTYNPGGYTPPAAYPRGMVGSYETNLRNAWIYSVLSLFCCVIVFAPLAFIEANKAEQAGAPSTIGPKIVAGIGIVLAVVSLIVRLTMLSGS